MEDSESECPEKDCVTRQKERYRAQQKLGKSKHFQLIEGIFTAIDQGQSVKD